MVSQGSGDSLQQCFCARRHRGHQSLVECQFGSHSCVCRHTRDCRQIFSWFRAYGTALLTGGAIQTSMNAVGGVHM